MIELKHILKQFKELKAVNDVSLDIKKEDIVIIEGESGSGKTTLLKIMGLMDTKFEGEYYLNGKNIKQLTNTEISNYRNAVFGYIFQDYLLVENETVENNIKIPLYYSDKFKKSEWKVKIKNISQQLNIEHLLNKKVSKLSGGERQRVAIARAFVNEPEIILMDEPTSALNRELSQVLMNYVYEYIDVNKATLIIVTHDINRVAYKSYCSIIMKDGKIEKLKQVKK